MSGYEPGIASLAIAIPVPALFEPNVAP